MLLCFRVSLVLRFDFVVCVRFVLIVVIWLLLLLNWMFVDCCCWYSVICLMCCVVLIWFRFVFALMTFVVGCTVCCLFLFVGLLFLFVFLFTWLRVLPVLLWCGLLWVVRWLIRLSGTVVCVILEWFACYGVFCLVWFDRVDVCYGYCLDGVCIMKLRIVVV